MSANQLNQNPSTARQIARIGVLVIIGIVAVLCLTLLRASWRTVRPGYVGVVFDKISHTVTSKAREPGWTLLNPFTQAMQEYPVTIQNYTMVQKGSEGQVEGDDSIKVQSSEGQQVNLDVVIQYQVNRAEAGALYEDWAGQDIKVVEDRVVRAYTRSTVPEIAALYGWEEITASKRAEIANRIEEDLNKEFAQFIATGSQHQNAGATTGRATKVSVGAGKDTGRTGKSDSRRSGSRSQSAGNR